MSWLRLTIKSDSNHVESITELLEQFEAASVSYQPVTDEALYGDFTGDQVLWQQTSISALLHHEIDIDILLACLRNRIGTDNILGHKIELLEDKEWINAHKEGYGPMEFGGCLYIIPSWLNPPAAEDLLSITIDPGLAFGTGAHVTTALCLEWLAQNKIENKIIIDYGCGSGILALAAARLGADKVFAIDTDPQAISAAQFNVHRNHFEKEITVSTPDQISLTEVDILIANILMNPLLELAPIFSVLVRPGGQIVLSGILAGQVEECLATYSRWFKMSEPEFRDEWAVLHGYR